MCTTKALLVHGLAKAENGGEVQYVYFFCFILSIIWLVRDYTKVVFRAESIPTTFETLGDLCETLYLKNINFFDVFFEKKYIFAHNSKNQGFRPYVC